MENHQKGNRKGVTNGKEKDIRPGLDYSDVKW